METIKTLRTMFSCVKSSSFFSYSLVLHSSTLFISYCFLFQFPWNFSSHDVDMLFSLPSNFSPFLVELWVWFAREKKNLRAWKHFKQLTNKVFPYNLVEQWVPQDQYQVIIYQTETLFPCNANMIMSEFNWIK